MKLEGPAGVDEQKRFGMRWLHHLTVSQMQEEVPNSIWQSYFKFAFIRNPWDRMVSLYKFSLGRRGPAIGNFEYWLPGNLKLHPLSAVEFLRDRSGKIGVDFVGRFESLEGDFRYVSDKLGIACSLPHLLASGYEEYRKYYNMQLRLIVKERFREDLEVFGYKF